MDNKEIFMIRAKAYEGTKQPKSILVENFGTEGQKNHFEKNKGFKDKRREEPFLKTLNQLFESVESIKVKGVRANQYKLGAAREEVAERAREIGANATNGNWKESTKHLDALILSHLENDIENHVEIENSIIGWMKEFRMVNEMAYKLYTSRFDNKEKNIILNDIKTRVSADNDKLVDASYKFIQNDIGNQRGILLSALNRMKKHGIIETFDRPKAMRLDEETGLPINKIDVDMTVYKNYTNKKRQLREELKIDDKQINNYKFEKADIKKKIDEYHEELKLSLSEVEVKDVTGKTMIIAISHVWIDLAIIVKATRKKTMDYLHKFNAEILKEYLDYKEEKYLSQRAINYKTGRTDERLQAAETIKDKNIEYKIAEDEHEQTRWAMGKSRFAPDYYETQARKSKKDFMEAIEILDRVYADKFIIDEEKIKQMLSENA